MEVDYGGFGGYPTFPLIDLSDMTVADSDCFEFETPYQGYDTWSACIEHHLGLSSPSLKQNRQFVDVLNFCDVL